MPHRLTRRVISLISTGASRLLRSFLCTHRKLISTIFTSMSVTHTPNGMAEMKASSLPLFPSASLAARTPHIHDVLYPGAMRAHRRNGRE